jgi:hypothetical protein
MNPSSSLSVKLCKTSEPIEDLVDFSSLHNGHLRKKYKVVSMNDVSGYTIGYLDKINHKIPQLILNVNTISHAGRHHTYKHTFCIEQISLIYRLSSGVIYYSFGKLPDDINDLINGFLYNDPKNPIVKISS